MATKAKSTTTKKARPVKSATARPVTVTRTTHREARTSTFTSWFTDRRYRSKTPLGAVLAELVGTFMLASIVLNLRGSSLFVAFALVAITVAAMGLSGGHLNPAISIAAWVTRRTSGIRTVAYVVAQVLGGMLALLVANALLNVQPADQASMLQGEGAKVYQLAALPGGKEWYIFFAEMLGASVFAYIFGSVMHGRKDQLAGAFAIGFGLFAGIVISGNYGVLNPAVALAAGGLKWEAWTLAIYVLAPILGAIVGMSLYKLFRDDVVRSEGEVVVE
jgi:glycerol uptake facilitator-like aquaporin